MPRGRMRAGSAAGYRETKALCVGGFGLVTIAIPDAAEPTGLQSGLQSCDTYDTKRAGEELSLQ